MTGEPPSNGAAAVPVTLTVVGSGDAFGTGGRHNACFMVDTGGYRFLMDCGASSIAGLKQLGVSPASISAILCTHFHGDHIGGVPFVLRDPLSAAREQELVLAGPPGMESRVMMLTEALFPGSTAAPGRGISFPMRYVELGPGVPGAGAPVTVGPLDVEAIPVRHSEATRPHAIRVGVAGRIVAYTGDTEWTDDLYRLAEGADLLIADGSALTPTKGHLDVQTLSERRSGLDCGRILLTHPGEEVLAVIDELDFEYAFDGMVLEV